jgi:hypothetical protein
MDVDPEFDNLEADDALDTLNDPKPSGSAGADEQVRFCIGISPSILICCP